MIGPSGKHAPQSPRTAGPALVLLAWATAIVATAVFIAAPWLDERLVPAGWLGVAAGLILATGRRGWRGELAVLAAAVLAIAIAFHWTPAVLADAMRTSKLVGFAFAVPIVLWDACRLALPFWVVGRLCRDPRTAWLPAGLVAVVAEAVTPGVFPWKLGYSQLAWPVTVQAAALAGPEASTLALFATAGAIVAVLATFGPGGFRRPPAVAVAAIGVVVANLAFGMLAIRQVDARMSAAPKLRLAVVQADPDAADGIDTLRRLTRAACAEQAPPALVCWPECSGGSYEDGLDSFADEGIVFRRSRNPQRGLRPLPDPACPLLLGGRIYRGYRERPQEIFQAALLIDTAERLAGASQKRHLMPFGEYVPFADVIPELRLSFPLETSYTAGQRTRPNRPAALLRGHGSGRGCRARRRFGEPARVADSWSVVHQPAHAPAAPAARAAAGDRMPPLPGAVQFHRRDLRHRCRRPDRQPPAARRRGGAGRRGAPARAAALRGWLALGTAHSMRRRPRRPPARRPAAKPSGHSPRRRTARPRLCTIRPG